MFGARLSLILLVFLQVWFDLVFFRLMCVGCVMFVLLSGLCCVCLMLCFELVGLWCVSCLFACCLPVFV